MRTFNRKFYIGSMVGITLVLMSSNGLALDIKRIISTDELSTNYGTINKKYDKKIEIKKKAKTPKRKIARPIAKKIAKGSFAYSLGNDAAKSGDVVTAVKHWKLASKVGNFNANWQLARFYLGALNGQKNRKLAHKHLLMVVSQYDLSSESRVRRQISADAMVELADFYVSGSKDAGVKKNFANALKLLKLASASVGHSKANFLLGDLYFKGKFVPKQKKRAVRYFTLSARKNYYAAQIKLGEIYYLQGKNVKARIHGLAWLMVSKTKKSTEFQNYTNQIIAKQKGKKLNNKQIQLAENLARQLISKWKF